MVVGDTGGKGTQAISKKYPSTDGLEAGTTNQKGTTLNLIPETSNVAKRLQKGL